MQNIASVKPSVHPDLHELYICGVLISCWRPLNAERLCEAINAAYTTTKPGTLTIEESRAQFEAAMAATLEPGERFRRFSLTDRFSPDAYTHSYIEYMWQGWELRRRTVSEGGRDERQSEEHVCGISRI
jgi:hypothetical protein